MIGVTTSSQLLDLQLAMTIVRVVSQMYSKRIGEALRKDVLSNKKLSTLNCGSHPTPVL